MAYSPIVCRLLSRKFVAISSKMLRRHYLRCRQQYEKLCELLPFLLLYDAAASMPKAITLPHHAGQFKMFNIDIMLLRWFDARCRLPLILLHEAGQEISRSSAFRRDVLPYLLLFISNATGHRRHRRSLAQSPPLAVLLKCQEKGCFAYRPLCCAEAEIISLRRMSFRAPMMFALRAGDILLASACYTLPPRGTSRLFTRCRIK